MKDKTDQPLPGSAPRRSLPAKNPPTPAGEQLAELQAQVLALRAIVEVLVERDSAVRIGLTKGSNSIITAVAQHSPFPVADAVLKRAKDILHLELKARPGH